MDDRTGDDTAMNGAIDMGLRRDPAPAKGEPLSEKEKLYRELERVQHKCARLKGELKALRRAATTKENAHLRREAAAYRKALSKLAYLLEQSRLTDESVQNIVAHALALRGMKSWQREAIRAIHASPEPEPDRAEAINEEGGGPVSGG